MKFENILFPIDYSERSRAAAPFVLSMAQRYRSNVVLLHAFEPPPPIYGGMNTVYPEIYDFEAVKAELRPMLTRFARNELPGVNTSCVMEMGSAAAVITEYAETNRMDLIAIPTHGYGPFRRLLLGSVTAKVLHDASIPVWTDAHAPEPSHRAHPNPRYILAALDMSPESVDTLKTALQLARDSGATLEIVHVAPEGEVTPVLSETRLEEFVAEAAREEMVKVQQKAGTDVAVVVDKGSVAKIVRSVAIQKRCDLLVIGRGSIQGGIKRLRANAYAIVREAPCPVISA